MDQTFQVSLPQEFWVMKSVDEGLRGGRISAQLFPLCSSLCCFTLVQLLGFYCFIFLKESFCRSPGLPAWCCVFLYVQNFSCVFSPDVTGPSTNTWCWEGQSVKRTFVP